MWPSVMQGCCWLLVASTAASSPQDWVSKAEDAYRSQDYKASADAYASAIEQGAKAPTTYYNAACSAALAGRTDLAFEWLHGAIGRGWYDIGHMQRDSDLKSLRDDARWADLLKHANKAEEDFLKSIGNPELRRELLSMMNDDQEVRTRDEQSEPLGPEMRDIDAKHTARMKEIVDKFGWPGKSLVGIDGALAAWLLVQHADADPAFQRRCLKLMQSAPAEEVSNSDLAYLVDRVRVNSGERQVYGTQFWMVDGRLVPRPIEDEANVDRRRADVGLETMAEYTKRMTGAVPVGKQD